MDFVNKTKKKLAFIFSLVLALIFFLGFSGFFTFKYLNEIASKKDEIQNVGKIVKKKEKEIINFIENKNGLLTNSSNYDEVFKILNYIDDLSQNVNAKFEEQTSEAVKNDYGDFSFFNNKVIILNLDKEVKYSNLIDYKKIDAGKYINDDKTDFKEKDLYIKSYKAGDYYIIAFFPQKYTLIDFEKNLIYSFVFSFCMFFIFFLISLKFVGETLKPVKENIENMENFIDNAGHELKTPLATIDSFLWIFDETKSYDEKMIKNVRKEIEKTNNLIETLRDLSGISKNTKKENFGVSEIIDEILYSYKEKILEKNLKIYLEKEHEIKLFTNKNYFYILVSNIVGNAIKYNKNEGKIKIKLGINYLEIEDSGIGIDKDNLKKVSERFYRVKENKGIEGHGLGLSIVKKISEVNNWTFEIKSEKGVGTNVKIIF